MCDRLVVFADYGLDDACATAYLLSHRGEYRFIDIVPVGGNVDAFTALKNACKLLAVAKTYCTGLDGVRLVDTSGVAQPSCNLPSVHGVDGMGDLFADAPAPVCTVLYEEWLRALSGNYRILSLGPCTMVKRTLIGAPAQPCAPVVIMGGCNDEEPNFNGYEFNDGLDPDSFSWVLDRPHLAVTLDTCRVAQFNFINRGKGGDGLLDILLNKSVELAAARHADRCYVYDYIAALALLYPQRFEARNVKYRGGVMRELRAL